MIRLRVLGATDLRGRGRSKARASPETPAAVIPQTARGGSLTRDPSVTRRPRDGQVMSFQSHTTPWAPRCRLPKAMSPYPAHPRGPASLRPRPRESARPSWSRGSTTCYPFRGRVLGRAACRRTGGLYLSDAIPPDGRDVQHDPDRAADHAREAQERPRPASTGRRDPLQSTSKRSSIMTLCHAATKSRTSFPLASSAP